jgi:TRAP-type C4-dicarboxylate transport system substrate-binding protein
LEKREDPKEVLPNEPNLNHKAWSKSRIKGGLSMKKLMSVLFLFSLGLGWTVPEVLIAADQPIILKWAEHSAPSVRTRAVDWWIAEVQNLSKGKVKIEPYLAESLVKAKDMPASVKAGTVDMATFVAAYYPDRMPALNVVDVAGITNPYAVFMSYLELYQKDPAMKSDFDRWNCELLIPTGTGETIIAFRINVENLDGFKGRKIRGTGYQGLFLNAVGAVPVPLPHPEIHMALERGTIDGALGFPYAAIAQGYDEIAPCWVRGVPGNYAIPVVINKNSWKKIPKDIQKIMLEKGKECAKKYAADVASEDEKAIEKLKQKPKGKAVMLSDADIARWRTQLKPVQEQWAKDLEGKGIPGKKLLEEYFQLIEKYSKK